jgi:hypothetical protein
MIDFGGGRGWLRRVLFGNHPQPKPLLLLLFILINDSGDNITIVGIMNNKRYIVI